MDESQSDIAEEVDVNLFAIVMNPEAVDPETKNHLRLKEKEVIYKEMKMEELDNLDKQEQEEELQDQIRKMNSPKRNSPRARGSEISKTSPYIPKPSRSVANSALAYSVPPYAGSVSGKKSVVGESVVGRRNEREPSPPEMDAFDSQFRKPSVIGQTAFVSKHDEYGKRRMSNDSVVEYKKKDDEGLAALFGNADQMIKDLKATPPMKSSEYPTEHRDHRRENSPIVPLPDASPRLFDASPPHKSHHDDDERDHHHSYRSHHHESPQGSPRGGSPKGSPQVSPKPSYNPYPPPHSNQEDTTVKVNGFNNYDAHRSSAPDTRRKYLFDQEANEDIRLENQAADIELRRLEREGIVLSRKFTPEDPLVDKLFEIESHTKNKEMIEWVNNVRDMMALAATGLDVINETAGPILKLRNSQKSWVDEFNTTSIDKMTNPLKKIYAKYIRKSESNPIFQILTITAGSLVMFHMKEVVGEKFSSISSTAPILPAPLKYNGISVVSQPIQQAATAPIPQYQAYDIPQASVSAENVPSRPPMEEP